MVFGFIFITDSVVDVIKVYSGVCSSHSQPGTTVTPINEKQIFDMKYNSDRMSC